MRSGDVHSVGAGLAATYLSAAEAARLARAERDADALAWFDRQGIEDIPIILGLVPEMCATGCGAEAVRMGYCDAPACQKALRKAAKAQGDAPYRKARKAVGTG